MDIREALHAKRMVTENHIRELEKEGKAGERYTAVLKDVPFLVLALLCDVGWVIHLWAGIVYFKNHGIQNFRDVLALIALILVMTGVCIVVYMNKIHEKEIATKLQKDLSFGLTVYAGLLGGIIGLIMLVQDSSSLAVLFMMLGGFINFAFGIPIYLSFQKGIIYGIQ